MFVNVKWPWWWRDYWSDVIGSYKCKQNNRAIRSDTAMSRAVNEYECLILKLTGLFEWKRYNLLNFGGWVLYSVFPTMLIQRKTCPSGQLTSLYECTLCVPYCFLSRNSHTPTIRFCQIIQLITKAVKWWSSLGNRLCTINIIQGFCFY